MNKKNPANLEMGGSDLLAALIYERCICHRVWLTFHSLYFALDVEDGLVWADTYVEGGAGQGLDGDLYGGLVQGVRKLILTGHFAFRLTPWQMTIINTMKSNDVIRVINWSWAFCVRIWAISFRPF